MNMGGVISATVAAIVMIAIVVTVVVPILQDASYDQLGNNTPTDYYEPVGNSTIAPVTGGFTNNGETVAFSGNLLMISDSIVVLYINDHSLSLYDYTGNNFGQISTIAVNNGTYTTTGTLATTGSVGNNCVVFTDDKAGATMGRFVNKQFNIDQDDDVMSFRIQTLTNGSNSISARILASGTVDDMDAVAVSFANGEFTNATAAEMTIVPTSYSEPNEKIYAVAANPSMVYSATVGGTEYTLSANDGQLLAPLEYTQVTAEGGAIEALINLTPLLMVVGTIIMIIAAFIIRQT